jgi:hypothetical protein
MPVIAKKSLISSPLFLVFTGFCELTLLCSNSTICRMPGIYFCCFFHYCHISSISVNRLINFYPTSSSRFTRYSCNIIIRSPIIWHILCACSISTTFQEISYNISCFINIRYSITGKSSTKKWSSAIIIF